MHIIPNMTRIRSALYDFANKHSTSEEEKDQAINSILGLILKMIHAQEERRIDLSIKRFERTIDVTIEKLACFRNDITHIMEYKEYMHNILDKKNKDIDTLLAYIKSLEALLDIGKTPVILDASLNRSRLPEDAHKIRDRVAGTNNIGEKI